LSALRETHPPVLEDRPAREARHQHASKKKQTKETTKKRVIRKAKEAEALKRLQRQQTIDGVPLAPSPSKTISGEDDDSSGKDDDALSR
jgi:ribosome biogenesis protein Tsr3